MPSPTLLAEPGKSPDARVAEAQARVSRFLAAADLLGVDNPDVELPKASLGTASGNAASISWRLDPCVKFVERPRTHRTTEKVVEEVQQLLANRESQLAAGVQDLQRLRAEARACPVPPVSHAEPASETAEMRDLR